MQRLGIHWSHLLHYPVYAFLLARADSLKPESGTDSPKPEMLSPSPVKGRASASGKKVAGGRLMQLPPCRCSRGPGSSSFARKPRVHLDASAGPEAGQATETQVLKPGNLRRASQENAWSSCRTFSMLPPIANRGQLSPSLSDSTTNPH